MAQDVIFNIAVFMSGLFVLDYGADTFVDHTVKAASRTGVSPTLISLLSAGAEFDELAVVVAAVAQGQSALAFGNILGSTISNILGAFSLGVIFSPEPVVVFDRSAKIYTSVLFALTTAFVLALVCFRTVGRIGGVVLIATFAVYLSSIGYFIFKGVLSPPEREDDDSDSDSDDDDGSDDDDEKQNHHRRRLLSSGEEESRVGLVASNSLVAINDESHESSFHTVSLVAPARSRSLGYHVWKLILGLGAISLAGYLLSNSISHIGDAYSISSGLLGTTVLSLATTLPEKLVAVVGSSRKQSGIVIASTVGSNIFLLTLCCGVLFVAGHSNAGTAQLDWLTVASVWASSLLLFGIVMVGARRWMGLVLFSLYLGFLVLEFILYEKTGSD